MKYEKQEVDVPAFFYLTVGMMAGCLFGCAVWLARICKAIEAFSGQ